MNGLNHTCLCFGCACHARELGIELEEGLVCNLRYCHCICLLTTQPHVTNICLYSLRSGLRSEGLLAIQLMSSVIRSTVILTWICSPSFASTAWWIPSDQRRFSTTLPVNCSHKPATRHQNICIYCPWWQFLMLWQAGFQANISRNSFNIQRWPAKMDTAGNSPNLINNLNLTVLHNVMDIPLVELLCLQSSHNKPATFLTLLTSKSCWHWHWKQSKKNPHLCPFCMLARLSQNCSENFQNEVQRARQTDRAQGSFSSQRSSVSRANSAAATPSSVNSTFLSLKSTL